MYEMRNDCGDLVAKLSNSVAGGIINGSPGHWEKRLYTVSGEQNVFVIDDHMAIGNEKEFGLKMMIWKGYYLKESKHIKL